MAIQKTKFTTFPIITAIFVVVGAVQYMVLEAITASAWHHPAYNYAVNYISDLGNPIHNDKFEGRLINSPLNVVMDVAYLTQGVLFIATALILWRRIPGRIKVLLLVFGLLHGVGIILVGLFHEQSINAVELSVHLTGALAAILGANLAAIVVGFISGRLSAAPWYRIASVVIGLIGMAAFVLLQVDHPLSVQAGGVPERIAVYAIVAWEAMTGVALLVSRARAGQAPTVRRGLAKPRPYDLHRHELDPPLVWLSPGARCIGTHLPSGIQRSGWTELPGGIR